MTAKCSVFIATSLDLYISRPEDSIDWLNEVNTLVPQGEDCGYGEFISTVKALVMGRNSFEQVLTFAEWPYGSTPVVVLSRRLRSLPDTVRTSVSLSAQTPAELVARLSAQGLNRLYVDGGAHPTIISRGKPDRHHDYHRNPRFSRNG